MAQDRSYPLSWPETMPRTEPAKRASGQFKTTLAKALKNVEDSLQRFGNDSKMKVADIVISSNYSLGQQNPKDPGVAVYFRWDDISTCIAVDRYGKIEHNLQAIHHCIEAERTKLRHGGVNLVRAAFRGYAALPPPPTAASQHGDPPWHEVLQVHADASPDAVRKAYRALRSKMHPDHGGNAEDFYRLNRAMDAYERGASR